MERTLSRRAVVTAAGATAVAAISGSARSQSVSSPAVSKAEFTYRNMGQFVAALVARQMSSAELVDQAIARIEAYDSGINAVVVRDFDRARVAAREADAALSR